MQQADQATHFSGLEGQQFANLVTFRKSGEAITTPVWFALSGGRVYVMTTMDSGKVKRIRNSGRAAIGPADRAGRPLGPTVAARARILPPEEHETAKRALDKKYGLMKAFFDFFLTLRGTERAWIEIVPGS